MTAIRLPDLDGLGIDWSGVASDDRIPVHFANMRVLERFGIPPMSLEEWLPQTTASPREFYRNLGIDEDPELLYDEYRQHYGELVDAGVRPIPYPDARTFFEQMVGLQLQPDVISSHPEEHLAEEARTYGIYPFVKTLVGTAKDKAWSILRLLSARNISPERYAYAGDTVYDIYAARGAGVFAIGVASGYHTRERLAAAKPDLLVGSLTELMYFLDA